jgi:hypothetical protein
MVVLFILVFWVGLGPVLDPFLRRLNRFILT